ncbi:MAG: MraY family glycosyltransferase [Bacteroidota bacterium]
MKQEVLYSFIAYFSFFAVSLFFSVLINGLLVKFSKTLGTRSNTDNQVRWNNDTKPSFGGISFFIIFLLSISALSFFFEYNSVFHNFEVLGIISATTLGFLMGLFDDAYNTKVIIKLLSQVTCGVILIVCGISITLFDNDFLNYAITIIWVVGIMNSINMLDNMDGIATVVSLFIFGTILIENLLVFGITSNINMVIIGIISALIGFLIYNWPPSKMFMGDTGSQFLGILLAAFSIIFIWNHKEIDNNEIPTKQICAMLVIFSLPIIDTATVSLKRIRRGKSPFVGGKDHTTHHLSYLGLSDRMVATIFTILSTVSMVLGLCCLNITEWNHYYTALFGGYFLILFLGLFYIANINKPKYENSP